MKIGLDVYHAFHSNGGVARYIRGLVPPLVSDSSSNQFVFFSNSFRSERTSWAPNYPNGRIVELGYPRQIIQGSWHYLNWPSIEMFTGSIDIFHGTHFVLPTVRRAKYVLTVHDLTYLRYPDYYSNSTMNEDGYRKDLPRALERADAVIAISDHTRRDLVELLGYPSSRIQVIHSGVEPHFFVSPSEEKLAETRERYDLDQPYLIFLVGTPEPRKNLLRTVAAARRGAPHLPLAIIGPQQSIRTLLRNELDGVKLLGLVPDGDLPLILHGAEIALYPSLYEGFGLPALEALASSVPLITSNRSALPEVVGNAAVLVDPESEDEIAEAIRGLLDDEGRRKELIRRGRVRAKEFSWDRTANLVRELYHQLA